MLCFQKKKQCRRSLVLQQVRDLGTAAAAMLLLCRGFNPWPGNFLMPRAWPKKINSQIAQERLLCIFFHLCFFFCYSRLTVLCPFLLFSIMMLSCIYMHSFSHAIFHHVLSQASEYSSLSCTAGPHCLSVLNTIVRSF